MPLHDLTGLEQAAAVRRGDVSPIELCRHYLDRIERWSDAVGAFITVTPELALARAQAAERQLTSGSDLPPLHGVPIGIKDLAATAGVRTTFGSVTMRDFVPEVSDEVVHRMEAAGLVSLGKTNTPEFGSPCYTEPEVAPPARTPWDLHRGAGGSSGGSASAVAAGLVPWAHGSDGGGSIRIPASACGLVGLKPSRGRVSGAPLYGDPIGLATHGPLARTVRDAAALLDAMAGPATGDPFWAPPLPDGESFLAWCDREPGRLRVGWFTEPVIADATVDPDCARAAAGAAELLAGLGHDVEEIPVPLRRDAVPVFETCWAVLSALLPAETDVEELRPLTRWLVGRGRAVSGPHFGLAISQLRRVAAEAVTALASYDVVLTPTLARLPQPVGAIRDDDDPARDFEKQKRFTPFTSAWNVTGMPAVSLPLHWADGGDLPVGVMLAGRPAEDHRLLALAAQVEAAAPWSDRHPQCWFSA